MIFFPCPTNFQIFPLPLQVYKYKMILTHSSFNTNRFSLFLHSSIMVPELEKPKVTEILVRMDCNGCVQKIKKALHGINGIYDLYIDFPQQKITIIGWVDPEKIVKAIKKTRKTATICVHTEPTEPSPPPPEGEAPPPAENPPPPEVPPAEPTPPPPPAEPQKDSPPPPPENPPPEPTPVATDGGQQGNTSGTKDVGEIHVIYHHPPDYGYRYSYGNGQQWNPSYHTIQGYRNQPPPPPPQHIYATHSYNTYRPSPYVTEYEYVKSPPRQMHYNRTDYYNEDYHNSGNGNRNGNISSMFSDENPNACRIM